MSAQLEKLFSPSSVAVIGASDIPQKVGAIVLKNIIEGGFAGPVYPVNPNFQTLANLKCYPNVGSLPQVPDLAVIAVPAALHGQILNQIGEAGIKNVVSYAAGFKEAGAEGAKLEAELAKICQKYGLNLLGPNCFGFVNNLAKLNVTFGKPSGKGGNLRFVMQSGALAASLFDWCESQSLGFEQFVTLGNKTVLNENDILQYFLETPLPSSWATPGSSASWRTGQVQRPELRTTDARMTNGGSLHPVGLYLESISDGPRFLKIAGELSKKNPVFILKPGKAPQTAVAMKSHTGAIAGQDDVLEAALKEAGIIRAQTLEQFFDLAKAFSWAPRPKGPNVAIISNAGGPAVISCDAVVEEGLELAQFSQKTREVLAQSLPRAANFLNPVDVLGDALADRFGRATEAVLKESSVDSLLVILTPQVMTQVKETANLLANLHQEFQKPIFCSFIGGKHISEGEAILNEQKIPNFRFPEQAIFAISRLWDFAARKEVGDLVNGWRSGWVSRRAPASASGGEDVGRERRTTGPVTESLVKKIISSSVKAGHKTLDNFESSALLKSAGLAVPRSGRCESFNDARSFVSDNGFPVVLKFSSPGLLHKKEMGGVITDIRSEGQLEAAWDALERQKTHLPQEVQKHLGIQIQKEVESGVEVIVGVKEDSTFGKVMLFGAGGSLAELVADRNLGFLPIDVETAAKMVASSKVYSLIKTGQGGEAYPLDKLYQLMVTLGQLSQSLSGIAEIEINPVIVTASNAWAVDGKVILAKGKTVPATPPQFKSATLESRQALASTFHYFKFQADEPLAFEPGQYLSVKVATERINCYSVAGRVGPKSFDLLVDVKPGGPGSKFFENLRVGAKIDYLGPFGVFTFKKDDGAKNLLFAATGSGISPLKCIIESLLLEQRVRLPIFLYFGLSLPQDIFFMDYFEKLRRDFDNFNYKIVIHEPGSSWSGPTGFVTEHIARDFPDASTCAAYLSGNKMMISGVSQMLSEHRCPGNRIYTEKF